MCASLSISGNLDLAAARHAARTHAAETSHAALRHDDGGGGLAAQLLQVLDRALDRFLRDLRKLRHRLVERLRVDLEIDRKRADRSEQLRLADVGNLPAGIG